MERPLRTSYHLPHHSQPSIRSTANIAGVRDHTRWLCLLLIGSAALIHVLATNLISTANGSLQQQRHTHSTLVQAQQEALSAYAAAQSPAIILARARALGMQPQDWGDR